MNRRTFLGGVLASFAMATALARTKLEVVEDPPPKWTVGDDWVTVTFEFNSSGLFAIHPPTLERIRASEDGHTYSVKLKGVSSVEIYEP